MRALLFSEFPARFLTDTILPRLQARGVQIVGVHRMRDATAFGPESADVVLVMHELGGHRPIDRVREAAAAAGLRVVFLSRKSSGWPEDLRDVAAPPEIDMLARERLEPMLRAFVAIRERAEAPSDDQAAAEVRSFWGASLRAPESGAELRRFVVRVLREPSCPAWFQEWAMEHASSALWEAERDSGPTLGTSAEEMLELYESENEELRGQLKKHAAEVERLTTEHAKMRADSIEVARAGLDATEYARRHAIEAEQSEARLASSKTYAEGLSRRVTEVAEEREQALARARVAEEKLTMLEEEMRGLEARLAAAPSHAQPPAPAPPAAAGPDAELGKIATAVRTLVAGGVLPAEEALGRLLTTLERRTIPASTTVVRGETP